MCEASPASVIKENGCAVTYQGAPEVEKVYETVCKEKNAQWRKADFSALVSVSHGLEGQIFHCGKRKDLELPLLGDHQLHNAAVVLRVADALIENGWKITEEQIRERIRTVSWPGP